MVYQMESDLKAGVKVPLPMKEVLLTSLPKVKNGTEASSLFPHINPWLHCE
jgi:hypothetical protein